MPKGPAFVATVVAAGFVALAVPAIVAMAVMMSGGHWGMMGPSLAGKDGSDPARERPVAGVTQVRVEDFAFSPANIVVDVGTTITWTNYDSAAHTVSSDAGDELDSPLFGQNKTFSHTFDEPGEFSYHCRPHPNMQGLVTVRAPGATRGSP